MTFREQTASMYRIWVNDFLTIERFAEYHDISEEYAREVIKEGKRIHEEDAELQGRVNESNERKKVTQ